MKLGTAKGYLNKHFLAGIIIFVLLVLGYQTVKISNMPQMEDIYFSSFDNRINEKVTTIYKYDARTKTVHEIGQVAGHFYNCEIDSEKQYILGLRNGSPNYPNEEKEIPGVEFGVVKFSLSDGTSEVVLSDKEMHELAVGDIRWGHTFPCGDWGNLHLYYYDSLHSESTRIIYNIDTKECTRIGMPSDGGWMYDIIDDVMWYRKDSGRPANSIIAYNMETGERKITVRNKDVWNCAISDDGTKIAFLNGGVKHIYLYDVNKKSEKCIIKAGWNRLFDSTTRYGSEWDRSGNYYCYIEYFPWFGQYDIRLKVYNVQTRKSKCIYIQRRALGSTYYEFLKNADDISENAKMPIDRVLFEVNSIGNPYGFSISILWLGVILFILWLFIYKAKKQQGRKIKILYRVIAAVASVIIIISIIEMIGSYNDVIVQYKNGNYIEVEGTVENYSLSSGDTIETFTLDGVEFRYSSAQVGSWGYCQTYKNSGFINGNGQHLRIRYIPNKNEKVIVYIEQLMPKEEEAAPH